MTNTLRAAAAWMFRDRSSGKLVIAQRPNLPLAVWIACVLVRWLARLHGTAATVVGAVGTVALVVWAGDEIARGVNPWRRLLGTAVLAALVVGWATSHSS